MFVLGKGDRLKVKDYLILLTDGKSNRGNIMTGATKCTSRNVSIIAVGSLVRRVNSPMFVYLRRNTSNNS
jgi:hypothetical protein